VLRLFRFLCDSGSTELFDPFNSDGAVAVHTRQNYSGERD
jgi:hypothetical protein